MPSPILVTKFFIPSTRQELVSRPRLVEQLNQSLDRKLTLVSAPAGFGKTTLVCDWLKNFQVNATDKRPYKIAWLSLDEDDNDFKRFLTYFTSALKKASDPDVPIGEEALSFLQTTQPIEGTDVLAMLINDLAESSEQFIFVLDDYHLIEEKPIDQAIGFLIDNLPPQLHLVINTRQDPVLSLGRLRARNQICELRAADLRFSSNEAAEFLNRIMGLNLSPQDIAELETRTEGWIAGLQLAAISMQGRRDHKEFIKLFTGGHRLVLDFLIEEVLDQQTENVNDFLLRTSILNRLTGSLCDAVTGQNYSQETLETLDRANLFIVPLDNERRWYRYHHLFAELLRQRLASQKKEEINSLHSKAAEWYEMEGELSEAVHHAFAGNDIKLATRLIEKGALAALENSNFRFILDSVEMLPESVWQNSPWLFIYQAWALLLTGQVEAANPKLEKIDRLFDLISEYDESQQQEIMGNIAGLKMISAGWTRDHENMPIYANQVREYLPEKNWIRAYCAMMMGGFFWGNGNLVEATKAFAESASAGASSGNKMVAVSGNCNHAHSLELAGHLHEAVELFQATFKIVEQDGKVLPVANYVHKEIARVLYELNELDLATQHLLEAISLGQLMADKRAEKIGYGLLTKVQIAKGDFNGAVESIKNAENSVPNLEVEFDLRGGEYPQVWYWLKKNKIKELEKWLRENSIKPEEISHFKTKFTIAMQARVLLALNREYHDERTIQKAQELIDSLLDLAEVNGWGSKVIEMLVLQALAFQETGNIELALTKLERALTLAEPEGFIRTFVDEGLPMAGLLYEAIKHGIAPQYVQRLLAAFPVSKSEETSPEDHVDQSGLIEPLTEREIEVLQLLAKGHSNQVIANRLYLSPHTVKSSHPQYLQQTGG